MRFRFLLFALVCACVASQPLCAQTIGHVRVDADPQHRIARFRPVETLGSTVDKEPAGSIPHLYSPANVRAMLGSGIGWLSYRLFTELSSQDWHWNPAGSFSAGNGGYWTSSASTANAPITDSFGYRLPHRGATTDQGNNEDYSRLDDGVAGTYWKSNPYLTAAYTGESDALHPQWVVIDLGRFVPVDAVRIAWAAPFATRYAVEFWRGPNPIDDPGNGRWQRFPGGSVRGFGGDLVVRVAQQPLAVRYVRVVMSASSHTCDTHGAGDRRNCAGYAIDEIGAGSINARGAFRDAMFHAPCGGEKPGRYRCGVRQTAVYVSSVDPWHTATDRVRNQEQPGLDLIARSGLTRGVGAMYPVPMLYSTPENAVAEVRYLRARGYAVAYIELGEEPDGQYVSPEDDAALYVQWARALHAFDPSLKLGGPVFSGVNSDLQTWPDAAGDVSWLHRFLRYLRAHGALEQLAFMSFEHYPFDGCEHGNALHADLLAEPGIQRTVVAAWRRDGLPARVPMFVTEANFSAVNFTQTPMQIEGALWLADYMAGFLTDGVRRVVYYQDEPVPLSRNAGCPRDWGNLTMFVAGANGTIHARGAQFFAMQMLATRWLEPGDRPHDLAPARTNVLSRGRPLVTAYAAHRPDGTWSLLLVNKATHATTVDVRFATGKGAPRAFAGTVTETTFGPRQYVWRSEGPRSRPDPNDMPASFARPGGPRATYALPALSLTVLRGRIAP